jgi:hypothetical protein
MVTAFGNGQQVFQNRKEIATQVADNGYDVPHQPEWYSDDRMLQNP